MRLEPGAGHHVLSPGFRGVQPDSSPERRDSKKVEPRDVTWQITVLLYQAV